VLCAATRQDLECTAFVNPDQSTVVVVLNRTESAIRFGLRGLGDKVASTLPARSIASYLVSA
jgi:O-glycosyl hydrolase